MSLPREVWENVNGVPAEQVAEVLGLKRAREHGKFKCPVHGGSDSLHAYPGGDRRGFYCWGACQQNYSNVDLAAYTWGLNPANQEEAAQACRQLADALGILVLDNPPPSKTRGRRGRRPTASPRQTEIVRPERIVKADPKAEARREWLKLREEGALVFDAPEIYAFVQATIPLGPSGAGYLQSRGFDPEAATEYGFRSLEDARWWTRLGEVLQENVTVPELELSGFWARTPEDATPTYRPPWGGRVSALILPYVCQGRTVALRFRRLDAADRHKYHTLSGTDPVVPFNAPALDGLAGEDLYVTEGEMDAYTLHCKGMRAVGLPGASTSQAILDHVARGVKNAGRVLAWYDADEAGEKGYGRLCDALQREYGGAWLTTHVLRVRSTAGKDANELAQKGLI